MHTKTIFDMSKESKNVVGLNGLEQLTAQKIINQFSNCYDMHEYRSIFKRVKEDWLCTEMSDDRDVRGDAVISFMALDQLLQDIHSLNMEV